MKKLLLFAAFFSLASISNAQSADYWVYYKDKIADPEFNPYTFFDQKAIDRRIKEGIDLYAIDDQPVSSLNETEIQANCTRFFASSRWLNASWIQATNTEIETIKELDCVEQVVKITGADFEICEEEAISKDPVTFEELDEYERQLLQLQTFRMQPDSSFLKGGFKGKGVRIAIFDAGFRGVDVHPAFEHIRKEGRLIKHFDFVRNKELKFKYMPHGTAVLSCIAGMIDSFPLGLATEAEFLLARTEKGLFESNGEEQNWLLAVEWADKNGASIINSSLGYTNQRYFPEQMNGKTAVVSFAAKKAFEKGILVINSAGNEGEDEEWKTIGAPADVDVVLSIGGTNPLTDCVIGFSSRGPAKSGRLKPNLCAFGTVYAATPKGYSETQGTSFSSPLVAGFAACAWEAKPELKNKEIFEALQKSGSLYPYYDYAHGYGIPQAKYFLTGENSKVQTFEFSEDGASILLDSTYLAQHPGIEKNIFYKVGDDTYIEFYGIARPTSRTEDIKGHLLQNNPALLWDNFNGEEYPHGKTVTIHFEGFTKSFKLKEEE